MKKNIKKDIKKISIVAVILVCVFSLTTIVRSKDYVAYYDDLFKDGFTIYSDMSYTETDAGLEYYAGNYLSNFSVYESKVSNATYNTLRPDITSCDYATKKCNIDLIRTEIVNYETSTELVKTYEDVPIIFNTDISDFFDYVNDEDKIVINHDEDMFADDDEKNNYISSFIRSKEINTSDDNMTFCSYSQKAGLLTYLDRNFDTHEVKNYIEKSISGVLFDFVETPFSDEFKKLTTGTITIKTNEPGEITEEILTSYLNNRSDNFDYSYSINGKIHDNKAFITLNEWENVHQKELEKHLINIVKDTDIDESLFASLGLNDSFDIYTPKPENINDVYNYTNVLNNNYYNNGSASYVTVIPKLEVSEPYVYVKYQKLDKNDKIIDTEFMRLPIVFKGYSPTYSDRFTKDVGEQMTINSDHKGRSQISDALHYDYSILSCNSDYTKCVIGLKNDKTLTMEIHEVNIVFDETMSEEFKKVFSINEDKTMDVIIDDGIEYDYYYSFFNNETNHSLSYKTEGDNWILQKDDYINNTHETHVIKVNRKKTSATNFFNSTIGTSRDFYIGETEDAWEMLRGHNMSKIKGKYYSADACDPDVKKCVVAVYNNDNILEIHNVNINLITETSDEYKAAFPDSKLKLNAIYKDDQEYLYMVSMANLMGKTKNYVYMTDYDEGKSKIVFNELESHTTNVDFVEGNPEHKAIIDEINERISDSSIEILSTDLEFINFFYYIGQRGTSGTNFNSKSFNDKLSTIINNKHVGFFSVPSGAAGDYYTSVGDAKFVLYYDGIAYAVTENYFTIKNSNIIYIPDDTEESTEAYIAAAQKRVDDYLGKDSGVTIRFNSHHDKSYVYSPDEDKSFLESYGIDITKYDGNDYVISKDGEEDWMLIIKDSSKMQKSSFVASDVGNNIVISSSTANYPTNTIVSSEVSVGESSKKKELLKKYGIENAQIVDIDLYSPTIGEIKEFENEEFEVDVPILEEDLIDEELSAVFISDSGKIEEYPMESDEEFAKFKTGHFSEYIIVKKADVKLLSKPINNPKTGDNIITYIIIMAVSIVAIAIVFILNKKKIIKK